MSYDSLPDLLPIVDRLLPRPAHGRRALRVLSAAQVTETFPLVLSVNVAISEDGDPWQTQTVAVGLRSVGEPPAPTDGARAIGMFDTIWGDVYAYDASHEIASIFAASARGGSRE